MSPRRSEVDVQSDLLAELELVGDTTMKMDEIAASMTNREVTSGLKLDDNTWTVVRVDGCGFSRLTANHFEKPFDARFSDAMVHTARVLLEEFQGLMAYTQSDEISLILPPHFDAFDRKVEKLVSVASGLASATLTHAIGLPAPFDGRVWRGGEIDDVADYVRWRQTEAQKSSLAGWCYWTLRHSGCSVLTSTRALEHLTLADKIALLRDHGVDAESIPAWQRRGVVVGWEDYDKPSFDPARGEPVQVKGRRLLEDRDIPIGESLREMVIQALEIPKPASGRFPAEFSILRSICLF